MQLEILQLHGCFTVGIGNQGKGILNNLFLYVDVEFAQHLCILPAVIHLIRLSSVSEAQLLSSSACALWPKIARARV